MDKEKARKSRWAWLPDVMPGVARLMAEKRRELGDAHVNLCWAKGMAGEPGWYYAAEGPVAIGVPWDDPVIKAFAETRFTSSQALVVLRLPSQEGAHADR